MPGWTDHYNALMVKLENESFAIEQSFECKFPVPHFYPGLAEEQLNEECQTLIPIETKGEQSKEGEFISEELRQRCVTFAKRANARMLHKQKTFIDVPTYSIKVWAVNINFSKLRILVMFFKDGIPILFNVENPHIRIQSQEGSLLFESDLSYLDNSKFVCDTVKVSQGQVYFVTVSASITGINRTFIQPLGFDS